MDRIIEVIEEKIDLIAGQGASKQEIELAEKQLGIRFASEYKEYLQKYGSASFDGSEFTGITPIERLNVVIVTKKERDRDASGERDNCYVIEQTGMDDIVIWQDESGKVYQTYGIEKPKQIFNSLVEYISL